ncbi:tagatose-bisphosphate aldolase [Paucisalibacillus globulus]|uniref:tagatose-bisphosphate aldolase n=1 Tax=Paucisalibacillus globulus TaxID=351095 RepID=UPI0003F6054D|nr:tagatose-bisphosphate aldolase [Paucisalibacillus globulus]
MAKLTEKKMELMKKLSNSNGVISALAIDQRGSLKKMMANSGRENVEEALEAFKVHISKELTPYSSSILLDPEYGWKAAEERDANSGLLVAYEETGYDASEPGRLPDLLPLWSAKRLKEKGADGVKFLLYYDIDESAEINEQKHAFVERIGSECVAEDIPFYLEILSYDAKNDDVKSEAYAKVKPRKVIEAMKVFSDDRFNVDVLKVEVPVNMAFVDGYTDGPVVYTKEEAASYFKQQSDVSDIPFIFLSAGVSAELFQETLLFAKEAGSTFNGVLCGRATWKDSVNVFAEHGSEKTVEWLQSQGRKNIEELNAVIDKTATPWWNQKVTI